MPDFQPRPDNLELGDQQQSFYDSQDPGISFLAKGCGSGGTTLAIEKMLKFLRETPAPRKNCPFWLIAGSDRQAIGTAWTEKMIHQHRLDIRDVNWPEINWYRESEGIPFSVPLMPHDRDPDGSNWSICFKSLQQNKSSLTVVDSIGGFAFIEELPTSGILEEVLRRTREYDFRGNKFCEFTPLQDPSQPHKKCFLQVMEETKTLPLGWKIYHASTEAAMRAGNISKEWFDVFFSLISPSEKETRLRGEWPPEIECPISL